MISFPNAKINLGLHINNKRPDGYHDIETLMLPIPFCDILEILACKVSEKNCSMSTSGFIPDCPIEENLCYKAYQLIKSHFNIGPVRIHLHKNIPTGAGLGGGSADAAFTLTMLNQMFSLKLGVRQLEELSAYLGSDCSFFIKNTPAIASGRGEILQAFDFNLSQFYLLLILPEIHISTAKAYENCKPYIHQNAIDKILNQPIEIWKDLLINDFEKGVFGNYPQLQHIKNQIYQSGAFYASMSGSGSAIFGLFNNNPVLSPMIKTHRYYIFKDGKKLS